jgi:hypothetical protein
MSRDLRGEALQELLADFLGFAEKISDIRGKCD